MTDPEILAALHRMRTRIDEAFAEDADRHQADKHLALEDIEGQLNELIDRLNP